MTADDVMVGVCFTLLTPLLGCCCLGAVTGVVLVIPGGGATTVCCLGACTVLVAVVVVVGVGSVVFLSCLPPPFPFFPPSTLAEVGFASTIGGDVGTAVTVNGANDSGAIPIVANMSGISASSSADGSGGNGHTAFSSTAIAAGYGKHTEKQT